MAYDLLISNGTVVTADAVCAADVAIAGGAIAALLPPGSRADAAQIRDAADCYVIPGAIDAHLHLGLPTAAGLSADDWQTGTTAAALGGTTTVVDFVDASPGQRLTDALAARLEVARPAVIDYGLHMSVQPDIDPGPSGYMRRVSETRLRQMRDAFDSGCATFKLYMAYAGNQLSDADLFRALREVADMGALACVHVENGDIIETLRQLAGVDLAWVSRKENPPVNGLGAGILHALTRPPESEREAVIRAMTAAELTGARMLIFHMGCASATEALGAARARGVDFIWGETCPQYLVLTDDWLRREDGRLWMCSPPLRPQADQDALWRLVSNRTIDLISSDHCPFSQTQKALGARDFRKVPNGVPGVETRLALIHHFGVRRGRIDLQDWVRLCCARPAEMHALSTKGRIAPGADADVVIFDPGLSKPLAAEALHSAIDWSAYDGITVDGWPRDVISRGEVIVRDGRFVGRPGRGRFIRRSP